MARGYRSRRYRAVRRSARRFKKSSSLRKIKKDILKCNFPTKVKFMGLPEKKVMFLTQDYDLNFTTTGTGANKVGTSHVIILDPMATENIDSILSQRAFITIGGSPITGAFSNWDKLCILGIYIKFQPKKNMWTANGNDDIVPVKCTYTMNNCPLTYKNGEETKDFATVYDKANMVNKQIFTFNSNEAFTIYVPAPTTMCSESPVVHKSKTWWSITDLQHTLKENTFKAVMDEDSEDEEEEGEYQDIASPVDRIGTTDQIKPSLSAGRIYLYAESGGYNITVNYKVALKG